MNTMCVDIKKMPFDFSPLKKWFLEEQRDLPWRQSKDPYAVWISEVMLQQTQVAVVLPYFKRWMEKFPTIRHLASASLEEVIKCWEGLGYYSRARHLHEGAHYLVSHFGGELPSNEEDLKKIKGLGPYTIGAILSFAFHQRKAAVDGNVLRVLTRLFAIDEDIAKEKTVRKLRELMEQLLPEEESWIVNEGLIELGATICQKKARCPVCPLRSSCSAYKDALVEKFPVKSKRVQTEYLFRAVPVLLCQGHYLLKRGKKGQVMSDLYEFPYFEITKDGIDFPEMMKKTEQLLGSPVEYKQELTKVSHGFTRYQVALFPFLMRTNHFSSVEECEWIDENILCTLPFSSGHRRILQQLNQG